MTRTNAGKLLDDIRVALAKGASAEEIQNDLWVRWGIPALEECRGEAHAFPEQYDHCCVCAPRWGWTGEKVKVR